MLSFDFWLFLAQEAIKWNIGLMYQWWYWPLVLALFYVFYGVELFLNGGGGSFVQVLKGLWEEFLWNIPGATHRRAAYIKEMVGEEGGGSFCGMFGSWRYEEIREKNLYARVGWSVLPSPVAFYGRMLGFAFLPISLVLFCLTIAVALIFSVFFQLCELVTGRT